MLNKNKKSRFFKQLVQSDPGIGRFLCLQRLHTETPGSADIIRGIVNLST
ncbi:MAG: hypothetical protein LKG56_10750 [Lachnospiraceae bacterium]|jgi:hypothetical protein|nr:hypothetical protein [Lachnospiraceae bacterium]MCH4029850.1 hypothetical protein [Lachnospiraceae bacterium]MCH4071321.1 hypothetical protein [Lachnospiraceae bacterium]MCH4109367.1 hypothetical protein [Lachnospiraceae bacterium]MCI1303176.1 hypothetical protein [Lachnospiraceae bacterium]